MKNWWIRFGCFLTGYNYMILRSCSEASAKSLKKYTAAILIVCIVWAFVGFSFTQRYLHTTSWGAAAGAALMVLIVIQIERQIILSLNPSLFLFISRFLIALMMAVLGAVVVDQIIFKDDIELEKMSFIQNRVDSVVERRTRDLRAQLESLDTMITVKEKEVASLDSEISKKPHITSYVTSSIQRSRGLDSNGHKLPPEIQTITTASQQPNPKIESARSIRQIIEKMRNEKLAKDSMLLNSRPEAEKQINTKVGFLDELNIMFSLLKKSTAARLVYILWFVFLLGLELLVLLSKANEKESDYEKVVRHHMELQKRKLDLLANMGT